jgi:hypothetical protein
VLKAGGGYGGKRLFNGATARNAALSRKVDRASATYSELKLDRVWLVMPENFASEYTVRFWCKRLQGGPVTMTASQDV